MLISNNRIKSINNCQITINGDIAREFNEPYYDISSVDIHRELDAN